MKSSTYRCLLIVATAVAMWQTAGGATRADLFLLRNGARLQGEWKNSTEAAARSYWIRTPEGIDVCVSDSQVIEHLREPPASAEYDRLAPTVADTATAQMRLAEWCRQRGLVRQRQEHLRRVVELDPQRADAWQALGYSEINGKWVTKEDFFTERGYVYFQGKWRLPQEVDVLKQRRQAELIERRWFSKLKSLRGQLGTDYEADAVRQIEEIRDPHAIPALTEYLCREKATPIRLLYVSALAQIPHPQAVDLLVYTALQDADAEVCHACVDRLVALQNPTLPKTLVKSLKHPNNDRVNRAAYLLGRLGDRSVIPALIASLVTTHQVRNPHSGRTTATLVHPAGSSPGSAAGNSETAFNAGSGPPAVALPIRNQEVLRALVQLTGGQSYGFDQRAWTNWYTLSNRAPAEARTLR